MIDAAFKALRQMFTPPFRAVLIKSILLGIVLIVLLGIGLYKGLDWLAAAAATGRRARSAPAAHDAVVLGDLVRLDRSRARHRDRRCLPDAGGDGLCRQLLRR